MLISAQQGTDAWTVVTAVGTVGAAIAAAVSAYASWKAARSSAETSGRATLALASLIAPQVRTRGTYHNEGRQHPVAVVAVNNDVDFPARDIEVEVVRRDGRRFAGTRDLLRKNDSPLIVEIGELDGPTDVGWEFLVVATVTIRFSDDRKLARYERIEDYSHLSEPPGAPRLRFSERRLWPEPGSFLRQPAQ